MRQQNLEEKMEKIKKFLEEKFGCELKDLGIHRIVKKDDIEIIVKNFEGKTKHKIEKFDIELDLDLKLWLYIEKNKTTNSLKYYCDGFVIISIDENSFIKHINEFEIEV